MLNGIKSKYIFEYFFDYIDKNRKYKLVKYNKKFQSQLNLSFDDYKKFSKIIIELNIKIFYGEYILFINYEQQYKPYYHVYFNDKNEEEKYPTNMYYKKLDMIKHFIRSKITNKEKEIIKGYFYSKDKIKKIKIIIDNEVKTLKGLFKGCDCINEIKFIQFNRKNIVDMSEMFYGCSSLSKLDMTNFITDNVTNMSDMFVNCRRIKNLNVSSFHTSKVEDMSYMFSECAFLKKIDLSKFDTSQVVDMSRMFYECYELENLDLSNFDTSKVIDMSKMFAGCFALGRIKFRKFLY